MANIREYHPKDYEAVTKIWVSTGLTLKDVDTREAIDRFNAENPGLFLVAEDENGIVGTVIGAWDGRRGWIYHLAVSSRFQGKGLARQLMEKAEAALKSKGATQVNLLVETDNSGALLFYKKVGYSGSDRVFFKKKI